MTNLGKEEFDLLGEVGIFNYCILTISMNLRFKLRAYEIPNEYPPSYNGKLRFQYDF